MWASILAYVLRGGPGALSIDRLIALRLLGREISGQVPEEGDVLELLRDSWAQLGIRLFSKTFSRDIFRRAGRSARR